MLNGGFQAGEGLFTLVARLLQLALLGALFVHQGLLLALFLFQHRFLHRHVFAGFLQLGDGFLARLVQIAKVGLQALITLPLFAAEDHLDAGMRPLTKRGVELRGKVTLLRGALTLQLGQRGVHFVDLLIQLVQRFLGFAQLARGGGDGLLLRF